MTQVYVYPTKTRLTTSRVINTHGYNPVSTINMLDQYNQQSKKYLRPPTSGALHVLRIYSQFDIILFSLLSDILVNDRYKLCFFHFNIVDYNNTTHNDINN